MKLPIAFAAVVLLAPTAAAQAPAIVGVVEGPPCEVLGQLVAAAPSGFAEHRGAQLPDAANAFESKLQIAGYTCAIHISGPGNALVCQSRSLAPLNAMMGQSREQKRIGACFPDWTRRKAAPVTGFQYLDFGDSFVRENGGAETVVSVLLGYVRPVGTPGPKRHAFTVTWRPPG